MKAKDHHSASHLFLAFYPLEGLSDYHSAAELLLGSFDSGKAWNVKKSGELMGVDLILVDGKEQAKLQICGRPCFAPIRRGP
ncbi:hypothetical protein IGI04_024951 [Brassica rapa subsp. trilocularis]|uniref:Uncharacterized protein n=1 Tax=Brassica rapa subsp. trilocularis TaxID=1813537 RepID=A0ABQ7M857_BRACM|nr:hypothetical protein IGI04_024951 [Brassica rapa subsp. trilocularis]